MIGDGKAGLKCANAAERSLWVDMGPGATVAGSGSRHEEAVEGSQGGDPAPGFVIERGPVGASSQSSHEGPHAVVLIPIHFGLWDNAGVQFSVMDAKVIHLVAIGSGRVGR